MTTEGDNVFDDDAGATGQAAEGDSKTFEAGAGDAGKTGDEGKAAGTPPEGTDNKDGKAEGGQEKMIPESRFKAALKDVTDKYDTAQAELNKLKAIPAPDKDKDPEGYNLHVRLETSKALMAEMKPDYFEVMKHYKVMADANPQLNVEVAKQAIPAKFAYDLAKKDMELRELATLKDSDEYKEFLAQRKTKAAENTQATDADKKAGQQVADGLGKVPNLNRATNVTPSAQQMKDDADDLFADSVL